MEEMFPLGCQEKYDNSGIQIGDVEQQFTGGIVCCDVKMEILEEAVKSGANMIISHHPVLFHPLKSVCGNTLSEKIAIYAIEKKLIVYSVHTNADNTLGGVNLSMGNRIGLQKIKALKSIEGFNENFFGSGAIGEFSEAIPEDNFLRLIKNNLKLEVLRHSKPLKKAVKKLAFCGGSGGFLIPEAIKSKADAFLVGETHYHDFVDYENFILILEVGHYESENWIKYDLCEKLNKKFSTFAVSRLERTPYYYL